MRLGVVGTGFIANMQAHVLESVEGVTLEAVCGISLDDANAYGDKYSVKKRYDSYDKILKDEDVDFIYICLPNDMHYSFSKKALEAGKNVICEKPFVSNDKEASDLLQIAKEKKLFLFDASTTRYMPGLAELKKEMKKCGQLSHVTTTYCQYSSKFNTVREGEYGKVFDLKYYGGALKDLGIYPVTFNVELFGMPKRAVYYPNRLENGCDRSGTFVLEYDGFISTNLIAKDSFVENRCTVSGYDGTFSVSSDCFRYPDLCFQKSAKETKEILLSSNQMPHYYEWLNFKDIFEGSRYDECYASIENTKKILQLLDQLAESAGIVYGQ